MLLLMAPALPAASPAQAVTGGSMVLSQPGPLLPASVLPPFFAGSFVLPFSK